jgi:hypothetical protein
MLTLVMFLVLVAWPPPRERDGHAAVPAAALADRPLITRPRPGTDPPASEPWNTSVSGGHVFLRVTTPHTRSLSLHLVPRVDSGSGPVWTPRTMCGIVWDQMAGPHDETGVLVARIEAGLARTNVTCLACAWYAVEETVP